MTADFGFDVFFFLTRCSVDRLLSGLKSRQAEQGGDMESVSDLFQYMVSQVCVCVSVSE